MKNGAVVTAIAAVVIAVATVGCGGGSDTLSCGISYGPGPDGGLGPIAACIEYPHGGAGAMCPPMGLAVVGKVPSCPAESRVGRCDVTVTFDGGTASEVVYSYPPLATSDARMNCEGRGTFTPLP